MPFATFTPENGKDLLRLANTGQLQIWDTVNDKPKQTLVGVPTSEGTHHAVAVSPCGGYAAIETREEKLYAWNLSMASPTVFGDGDLNPCVEGLGLGRRCTQIQLSRGGQYFAAYTPERNNDAVIGELSEEAKPGRVREAILFGRYHQPLCLCVLLHQLLWLYTRTQEQPIPCHTLMSPGGMERRCAECGFLHR